MGDHRHRVEASHLLDRVVVAAPTSAHVGLRLVAAVAFPAEPGLSHREALAWMVVAMCELTAAEQAVMSTLAAAWATYLELPIEHLDDQAEFRHAFHRLQRIVLVRPMRRTHRDTTKKE